MNVKKILATCVALVFVMTAVPCAADARKKRKDGPDEPKVHIVIVEPAATTR
jgi:hypothetical protein